MNVFVLCTGRCGSTTFAHACGHITNYSAAHESNMQEFGARRLTYPEHHIEVDNRLSWFLGRLDQTYGDGAFYVHLRRARAATARSYAQRNGLGYIMFAYARGVYVGLPDELDWFAVGLDYYDTVHANIELFLRDKTHRMDFALEHAKRDFQVFWERIGAHGDLAAALAEWDVTYNAGGGATA